MSIDDYVLLAGGDANEMKKFAYQRSWGAASDYIQHYST